MCSALLSTQHNTLPCKEFSLVVLNETMAILGPQVSVSYLLFTFKHFVLILVLKIHDKKTFYLSVVIVLHGIRVCI